MKDIKKNILLLALFAVSPLMLNAQTTDDEDTEADSEADTTIVAKKKVHVAFRDKDPEQLLGGISYEQP